MKITILTDNQESWIIPFINKLKIKLSINHSVNHIYSTNQINKGDLMLILACNRIVSKSKLSFHKNNVVVHPSKLPKGRGWSPLSWQILEGLNEIPITLFEASEGVDEGDIYLVDKIILNGYELNDEIKKLQGEKTIEMILDFIKNFEKIEPIPQKGEKSYYKKRSHLDSEIDLKIPLEKQFNLLRIVDNERYPAFFWMNGHKYILKIYKENENSLQ